MRLAIASKPVEDWDRRKRNIAASRAFPAFMPVAGTTGPVAICAAGPSLLAKLPLLRALVAADIPICAVKGVASVLLEHGITPQYAVFLDSRTDQHRFLTNTSPETIYCLASQVDPEVYRLLRGHDIRTWNAWDSALNEYEQHYVTGGSTTGLRAINLMRWAGYTSFHLFGFDCSFNGETSHVYEKPNLSDKLKVRVGGRTFWSTPEMIFQHQNFIDEYVAVPEPLNARIYGDGMLARSFETLNAGRADIYAECDDLPADAVPLANPEEIEAFMKADHGQPMVAA